MLFFLLCIILFCFYSLFILFQHYFKDYKRHLVAGNLCNLVKAFLRGPPFLQEILLKLH